MEYTFSSVINKREDECLKAFLDYYIPQYHSNCNEVTLHAPDSDKTSSQADYFIDPINVLVEIKEIHDERGTRQSASWGQNVQRLKGAIDNRKKPLPQGYYSVETPNDVRIKRGRENDVIEAIITAIKEKKNVVKIAKTGTFKIKKGSGTKSNIVFHSSGFGGRINAAETIHSNIQNKVKHANTQLRLYGTRPVSKRILLLVNRYFFGDDIQEHIEALSKLYRSLLSYKNIDEIWIQNVAKDQRCIYTRDFLVSFDKGNIKKDERTIVLFQEWYYALDKLGDEQREKLFKAVRKHLRDSKPGDVYKKKYIRETIVRLGLWLADKNRWKDVIWIIDKFIDDPDPGPPDCYSGDPEFNYHLKIVNGQDPMVISTVLGQLAWVVQKLTVEKKYFVNALDYTVQLANHSNFNVKLQAIIPLIEISSRRQWLDGYGTRPYREEYKKFHELCFRFVRLVKNNPSIEPIAKWLTNVFAYYKDISTDDAKKVMEALHITDESAGLYIHFALYRKNYFEEIAFRSELFSKMLLEIIADNKDRYSELRGKIAWNLWKILSEDKTEFNNLRSYIDLFIKRPYERETKDYCEMIIEESMDENAEVAINWYKEFLRNIEKQIDKQGKKITKHSGVWLMRSDDILNKVAEYNASELLEIVEVLVNLWKKGCFIGSPNQMFRTFRYVKDDSQKDHVKKDFKEWYQTMKKMHPKLESVNWEE